jgi:hypothetical protein
MPHAITAVRQNTNGLDEYEKTELELLLKTKLEGVPSHHLPTLNLADILDQTSRALLLPNIPPDIQLRFFLHNRATIENYAGKPIKDEGKQSFEITRAIWFYRLDEAHQFQRFHDIMRWNTAIYVALLAIHSESNERKHSMHSEVKVPGRQRGSKDPYSPCNTKDTYKPIPPAAIHFITQYLAAVLEHHNTPTSSFTARESFIRAWKSGPWDLFTVFGGAPKKLMKSAMKRLSRDWEAELAVAEKQMGRERYEREVGKFVGGLVPGRKDQGVRVWKVSREKKRGDGDVGMGDGVSSDQSEDKELGRNELLEALLSPFVPRTKEIRKQDEARVRTGVIEVGGTPVTDMRYAISTVQMVEPRDILPALIRLFPELSAKSIWSL